MNARRKKKGWIVETIDNRASWWMWIILTVPVPPAELNVNILDLVFMSVFYSEVFGYLSPSAYWPLY
ncbi:hypothetical protein KQX54_002402 [Cotesia glomerata]|uniref:Uncharacterized protein n=1 Tax=Cotesia glomerata TaxID=32391 RepID=A0AAV7J615_COTGL|nr:hypothetical protein KQX54_002402 [Cotesia glomerata]